MLKLITFNRHNNRHYHRQKSASCSAHKKVYIVQDKF